MCNDVYIYNGERLTPYIRVSATTTSMLILVADVLTTISTKETFLQYFLDMLKQMLQNLRKVLKQYYLRKACLVMSLESSITLYCVTRS